MAWIDVTSSDNYDGAPIDKHTINTDNVAQITSLSGERSLIFFSCANANMAIRLEVLESREEILQQIRQQEGRPG
jgi:hypothetical protein